ncbi:MAG: flagellar hook protein FlgE [Alphaproteobacteria bacterium]
MSIYGAMFSGVSALNAHSNTMGMIADNISNLNTVGYKHTNARFSTLVTASSLATKYAPGGVRSSPFQVIDRQGLLQASQNPTDIAITGNGFFVVNEAAVAASGDRFLYTRAGQFSVDNQGYLVNNGGHYLQGWGTLPDGSYDVDQNGIADPSNPDPTSLTSLQAIQVSSLTSTATPTSTATIGLNLPATAAVGATQTMTVKTFDSLGIAHNVALEWQKTVVSPATWTLAATGITRADNGSASTTLAFPINIDTVVFGGNGTPSSFSPTALAIPSANWTTGASASSIAFGLGTVNQADGVTQFAGDFTLSFINQNGVPIGRFQSVEISDNGLVTALFDNGGRRSIYRLPVATFPNPNALSPVSGNAWIESAGAGNHFLNEAGTSSAGKLSPSSLESSTVDLGEEFTTMIITQRAYTASTRIITTADEMLEELVRIKR